MSLSRRNFMIAAASTAALAGSSVAGGYLGKCCCFGDSG